FSEKLFRYLLYSKNSGFVNYFYKINENKDERYKLLKY
ncbi:conserved hypothetical protein, partial [Listeria monocytogenes FSL F2-208]